MAKHIMCDLETLGTGPNAAVLSAALVVFDDDKPLSLHFDGVYYRAKPSTITGDIDADTVVWWMQQSDDARKKFSEEIGAVDEATRAGLIQMFLDTHKDALLWGNGASFDNVILRSLFKRHNLVWPIKYNNDRCYRTVKALFPQVPKPEFRGTPHDAWDDAVNQAEHLYAILQHLRGK